MEAHAGAHTNGLHKDAVSKKLLNGPTNSFCEVLVMVMNTIGKNALPCVPDCTV